MLWIVLSLFIATPMPAVPVGCCFASTPSSDGNRRAIEYSWVAAFQVRAISGLETVWISVNNLTPTAAPRHRVSRRVLAPRSRALSTAPVRRGPRPVLGTNAHPSQEHARAKRPAAPFQAHAPPVRLHEALSQQPK